jgi:16S rRNA (cytosine1402-N4)-methyltransferase
MSFEFKHYTVMKNEAVDALQCREGLIYVDCTLGGGGHTEEILKRGGTVIAFDVDGDAIAAASERLKDYKNLTIVHNSYTNIKKVLQELGVEKITGGVLFDLGASAHQFACAERGFSFSKDAPLDMRFGVNTEITAADIVNTYKEPDLVRIFSEYGEERFSKRIAKAIVGNRPIQTTKELADLIISCTPRVKSSIHPATRVFQALRIEVNQELQNIKNTLNDVLDMLDINAIIVVISFHSLEDRIVKHFFRESRLEVITKKPLSATEQEIRENPPSRSAKLRVARLGEHERSTTVKKRKYNN